MALQALSNPRTAPTFSDNGIRNQIEHLSSAHGVTKDSPNVTVVSSLSSSRITLAFQNAIPKIEFNSDDFRALLIRWIIKNNISFRQVETSEFRYLLQYLVTCTSSPTAIFRSLPHSANTIKNWILDAFQISK